MQYFPYLYEYFHSWTIFLLTHIYFALHFFLLCFATIAAGHLASTLSCNLLQLRFHDCLPGPHGILDPGTTRLYI